MPVDVALVASGGMLAFFFSFHAYALMQYNNGDRWNQALSIFLILMSFVTVWTVGHTTNLLASTLGSSFARSTEITYWVGVIGGTVTLAYFVLRILFNTLELAFKGGNKKL